MNSLYHLAIIEGYIAQSGELPQNVYDAVSHFKNLVQQGTNPSAAMVKKRKKRKLTPEARQELIERMNEMRRSRLRKLAQEDARIWTAEKQQEVRSMIASGKSHKEISVSIAMPLQALNRAIYKHKLNEAD